MSYRKTLFHIGLCLSSVSIALAQSFQGIWSAPHACPVSCGTGQTYRDCLVNGQQADYSNCQGSSFVACDTGIQCPSFPGQWSAGHACPVSCGVGQTYRDCLVNGEQADYSNCQGSSFIPCNTGIQCPSSSSTGPSSSSSSTGHQSSSSTGHQSSSSSSTGHQSSSSSTGHQSSSSSTGHQSSSSSSTGVSFRGVWSAGHACPVSCGVGQTYRDCLVNGQQADYSNCQGSSSIPCDTGVQCPSSSSTGAGSSSSSSSSTGHQSSSSTGHQSSSSSSTGASFRGVWSAGHACPVSCGVGQTYRDCLVNGQQADYSNCQGSSFIPCDTGVQCPSFPGQWSAGHACPVSCGSGQTYRDCLVNGEQADYSNCQGSSAIACSVSTPCP